ncbi:MAG: glycosyltransferase [Pseudomonadota bacterium]
MRPEISAKLTVIVISLGRPECLCYLTQSLNAQSRLPDRILYIVTDRADAPSDLPSAVTGVRPEVIVTKKGTCHQRNCGLNALDHKQGVAVFFDDDHVPAPNALENIEKAFAAFGPSVGGMSGHLIADGISGPGISFEAANALIAAHQARRDAAHPYRILKETIGLYGCNMALRVEAIGDVRFDEALPLYAWQEDVDFAHRVARRSSTRMVLTDAFSGVHRGVKNGRERRGVRLGYSQFANNWYLWAHNHLPWRFALRAAGRNFAANHLKLLQSEPWIDRKGRAYGNWLALFDILTRQVDPQRVHRL